MATNLLSTKRKAEPAGEPVRTRLQTVPPTRQRRRAGLVAAALLLALLGAMAVTTIGARLGDRRDVLVLVRDVPYGAVVSAEDLGTTAVAVEPGVDVISGGDLRTVIGRVAGADLAAGTLLSAGLLRDAAPPEPGDVLVPIAVPRDRLPADGLVGGDRLDVVDAPASAALANTPAPVPRTFTVEVVRLGEPDVNGVSMLDVVVAEGDGRALAALAATGDFALVLLPTEPAP